MFNSSPLFPKFTSEVNPKIDQCVDLRISWLSDYMAKKNNKDVDCIRKMTSTCFDQWFDRSATSQHVKYLQILL